MTTAGVVIISAYYIVLYCGFGVLWGLITRQIIKLKGYEENWFWWGFFFWIFAVIAAICKEKHPYQLLYSQNKAVDENGDNLSESTGLDMNKLKEAKWQCCVCGTVNAIHVQNCKCGMRIANKKNLFLEK